MGDADIKTECIVVGAGIAGLLAARALDEDGWSVIVLDKGKKVGGRMATRHMNNTVFDYGAQFFTVRDDQFAKLIEDWQACGWVEAWGRGFVSGDYRLGADGHPRYRGAPYMRALPERLAEGLDVRCDVRASAISATADGWSIETSDGARYAATTLLLTPPVPQSIELLDAGSVPLDTYVREMLSLIEYDPCIALMAELDGPAGLPEPGAVRMPCDSILWMADNHAKGVSPENYGVTIHASPAYSRDCFEADDHEIENALIGGARDFLDAAVVSVHIHRWRYSQTLRCHPEPCLLLDTPAPLVFAGDGFGGPRVEGAALSGLAAAERLISRAK